MRFFKDHWDVLLTGAAVTLICCTGVGAGAVILAATTPLNVLGYSIASKAVGIALVSLGGTGAIATTVTCSSVVETRKSACLGEELRRTRAEIEAVIAATDKGEEKNNQHEEALSAANKQCQHLKAEVIRLTTENKRLQDEVARLARLLAEQANKQSKQDQDSDEEDVPSRASRAKP